jgi:hypothetical protein
MTKAFLPEYSQMPYGTRYRPLFRLFAGENWRFVRKDGQPTVRQPVRQSRPRRSA